MKRLLVITTALTALAAGPAHAGPVAAAAAWVGSVLAGGGIAAAAMQMALSVGLSAIAGALMPKPKAPKQSVAFDVQMGDDLPLTFVAGDYATAGKRKYIGSWGRETRFITEVIEYSALPQGLEAIWVNDEPGDFIAGRQAFVYPDRSPENTTGLSEGASVPGGTIYAGRPLSNLSDDGNRIYVKVVEGTQTAADPFLRFIFGDDPDYPWTANHIGRGKSYVIITTRYDSETLTSYPSYLMQPAPLPMYDWRFDSTAGGSGPQRWDNRATYQPSRNPAVIAYNIIRGIHYGDEWVYGGKNNAAWRLPLAEWTAAANACDATVSIAGGGTEPRYRCGLEIAADNEPASVLEEIGKAANMRFAEVGGRIKPIVDLPGAAVFSFTDADILITEGQGYTPFYPVSETFNAINATYPERGEKWSSKDAPEFIHSEAMAEDGQYLPAGMTYAAAPFRRQVQRLMRSQMRDFRRMRRHQFYLPPDAYALEPGVDRVVWTSERNGYSNKAFLVESVAKTAGMNVLVSLREINPADYDWSSDFERPVTITPPVNQVRPVMPSDGFEAEPHVVLDQDGVTRRAAILTRYVGDVVGVTHFQIQARIAGQAENEIDSLRRFEPQRWVLRNVLADTDYLVRGRLISDIGPIGQFSPWRAVRTPNVKLGGRDIDYDEIKQEVREDLADWQDWMDGTGGVIRRVQDEIDAIRDEGTDSQFGAFLARQQIRQELAVEVGTARASFEDQIDVIVREQMSAAIRTTQLRAELNTSTALVRQELIAATGPDSALAARIDSVEAAIGDAVADATQGLISRVEDVEGGLAATSDAITTVSARTDRGTANGQLRAFAASSPSGVSARIGMTVEATSESNSTSAAFFLDATSDGIGQAVFAVDRFAIATGAGPAASKQVPFVVNGGVVYIDDAFIRNAAITNAKIGNGAITNAKIGNLEVQRIKIAGSAVTVQEVSFTAGSTSTGGLVQSLSYTIGRSGPQTIDAYFELSFTGDYVVQLWRDNAEGSTRVYARSFPGETSGTVTFSERFIDPENISGAVTYNLIVQPAGPQSGFSVSRRFIGVLNAYK